MWGGSRRRILQSFFFQSFRSKYIYNHPSGKKCLYREKFYEEMWVNRLNDASNLYGIRRVSKCAFSHSLWHLRWLQKSIPHLLVVVQWMHTIHKVLNTIRIMLSYDVPLICHVPLSKNLIWVPLMKKLLLIIFLVTRDSLEHGIYISLGPQPLNSTSVGQRSWFE